jgi:TolB-like protein
MTRTLGALVLLAIAAVASAAGRTKIAVTEIKNVQGVQQGTATILSDIIVSEVAKQGYDVISQSDINAMIGFEKQKKALGCSDADSACLAEIGGALGVDFMVAGQVGQIGSRYRISLLLVDTKRAKVAARSAQFCDKNEDALAKAAETTLADLLRTARATEPSPPPVVAQPAPAATQPSQPPPQPPSAPATGPAAAAPVTAAPAPATPPALKPSVPPPAASAGSLPPPPVAPAAARSRPWNGPAWITMGAGVALVAGGVVTGFMAKGAKDDLEARRDTLGYLDYYPDQKDKVHRLALTSDVLTAAGVVTAGVGGFLWFRGRSASLAVAPAVGAGQAGVVAAASF